MFLRIMLALVAAMAMAHGSPEQVAADWAQGLAQKQDKISRGIDQVSTAPGMAAAAQRGAYLANVQSNVSKWENNVRAVGLEEWKAAAKGKGVPRIATGAAQAQPKFAQRMGELLPYVDRGKGQLPPRGSFEQNKTRMNQWADYMRGYRRGGGGRGM